MPTVLTSSQQTFVDITDQRKLSAYITSNLPKTQSENPNVLPHTYVPSWAETHLVLTPVLFLDQTNLELDAAGVTQREVDAVDGFDPLAAAAEQAHQGIGTQVEMHLQVADLHQGLRVTGLRAGNGLRLRRQR